MEAIAHLVAADLVTAGLGSADVSMRPDNSDGKFRAAVTYLVGYCTFPNNGCPSTDGPLENGS